MVEPRFHLPAIRSGCAHPHVVLGLFAFGVDEKQVDADEIVSFAEYGRPEWHDLASERFGRPPVFGLHGRHFADGDAPDVRGEVRSAACARACGCDRCFVNSHV